MVVCLGAVEVWSGGLGQTARRKVSFIFFTLPQSDEKGA